MSGEKDLEINYLPVIEVYIPVHPDHCDVIVKSLGAKLWMFPEPRKQEKDAIKLSYQHMKTTHRLTEYSSCLITSGAENPSALYSPTRIFSSAALRIFFRL